MRVVARAAGNRQPCGSRNLLWRAGLGLLCVLFLLMTAARASAAVTSGPLLWTAPAGVETNQIDSLSCVSSRLCVGVDRNGGALWSTDPTGGRKRWHWADIDGGNELTGIACPDSSLCVAVDAAGNAVTSLDPTAGASAWHAGKIDTNRSQNNTDNAGSILLRGVSCPSASVCVAVDSVGDSLTSNAPVASPAGWVPAHIDTNTTKNCSGTGLTCQPPLTAVSCPSTAECAAVDFAGNLLTTGAPGSATTPWRSVTTDGGALSSLYGVSCPVIGFCATVDGPAGKAITFNPATSSSQSTRSLPYSLDGIWCASRSLCLASVETQGGLSGLLGSFNPASPRSTWSLSSLGGIDAVACPKSNVCLAADDEGNIAAGVTSRAVRTDLGALLSRRHLPTIAKLARGGSDRMTMTSQIAARASLTWTVRQHGRTITAASAEHRFGAPGRWRPAVRLTPSGRALFHNATGRVRVSAAATFAASTGSVRRTARLTFTHPRRKG